MTTLESLTNRQEQMMRALGIDATSVDMMHPLLRDAVVCMMIESGEVVSELSNMNKPWKNGDPKIANSRVREELIDVLFYLLEIWILIGMSPEEVDASYSAKWKKNMERIINSDRASEEQKAVARELLGLE